MKVTGKSVLIIAGIFANLTYSRSRFEWWIFNTATTRVISSRVFISCISSGSGLYFRNFSRGESRGYAFLPGTFSFKQARPLIHRAALFYHYHSSFTKRTCAIVRAVMFSLVSEIKFIGSEHFRTSRWIVAPATVICPVTVVGKRWREFSLSYDEAVFRTVSLCTTEDSNTIQKGSHTISNGRPGLIWIAPAAVISGSLIDLLLHRQSTSWIETRRYHFSMGHN